MTFDRRKVIRDEIQKWFDEPVFFGYDFIPQLKECVEKGIPFIYGDHAYFNRGYPAGNFRIIRNDVHQRTPKKLGPRPGFRYPGPRQDKGSHILVFPPSKTMQATFNAQAWTDETLAELQKRTDRKLIVKKKDAPEPLSHYLKDAHAVVGYGSVASVESVLQGVPSIAGPRCPTTMLGQSLDDIESPSLGDTEEWFNTLCWSQFHISEIKSGFCKEVMNGLG